MRGWNAITSPDYSNKSANKKRNNLPIQYHSWPHIYLNQMSRLLQVAQLLGVKKCNWTMFELKLRLTIPLISDL